MECWGYQSIWFSNHRAERVPSETGQLQLGNSSSRHFFRQASSSCWLHASRHALVFFGHRPKVELIPNLHFLSSKTQKIPRRSYSQSTGNKKMGGPRNSPMPWSRKGGFICSQVDRPQNCQVDRPLDIYIYIYISIYIYIEGFPQMVGFPNKLMGFSYSKWSFWAVKWGYHHLRKHPYLYRYTTTWYYSKSSLQNLQFHQFSPKKDVSLRRNNIPSLSLEMTATSLSYTVTLPVLSTYHI